MDRDTSNESSNWIPTSFSKTSDEEMISSLQSPATSESGPVDPHSDDASFDAISRQKLSISCFRSQDAPASKGMAPGMSMFEEDTRSSWSTEHPKPTQGRETGMDEDSAISGSPKSPPAKRHFYEEGVVEGSAKHAKGFSGAAEGFSKPCEGFSGAAEGFSKPCEGFSGAAEGFSKPGEGFSGASEMFSKNSEGFSGDSEGLPKPVEGFSGASEGFPKPVKRFSGAAGDFSRPVKEFSGASEGFSKPCEEGDVSSEAEERFSKPAKDFSGAAEGFSKPSEEFSEAVDGFSNTGEEFFKTGEGFSGTAEGFSKASEKSSEADTPEGFSKTSEKSSEADTPEGFFKASEKSSEADTPEGFSEGDKGFSKADEGLSGEAPRFSEEVDEFSEAAEEFTKADEELNVTDPASEKITGAEEGLSGAAEEASEAHEESATSPKGIAEATKEEFLESATNFSEACKELSPSHQPYPQVSAEIPKDLTGSELPKTTEEFIEDSSDNPQGFFDAAESFPDDLQSPSTKAPSKSPERTSTEAIDNSENVEEPSECIADSESVEKPSESNMEVCEAAEPVVDIDSFTADRLCEYVWPQEGGELYFLQEQICDYLNVKSFKRKYPDLVRRTVEMDEKQFLKDKGAVNEVQCDLGLTALRSEEVLELMSKDYPDQYKDYIKVLRDREQQSMNEKLKELAAASADKNKMVDMVKKAVQSAAEYNAHLNQERREERRSCMDLQTYTIHYPFKKDNNKPKVQTKPGKYPVALLPGQYQDYYKVYSADELKYLPVNTVLYGPMKELQSVKALSEGSHSDSDDSTASDSCSSSQGSQDDSSSESEKVDKDETPGTQNGTGEKKDVPVEPPYQPKVKPNATCKACKRGPERMSKPYEELVHCANCDNSAHPSCIELTPDVVDVLKTYPWQCMDCKVCSHCTNPDDEDKMLFCDICDRGYHTFCVGLKSLPQGKWVCRRCGSCYLCGATQPGPESTKSQWQYEITKGNDSSRRPKIMCQTCYKKKR